MSAWWKDSVVYEIYVKSFQDSNHDGIGDLGGIIQRLDYLKELGVDVLWLTPVYENGNEDNGYDISDYRSIMNQYGSMDDFEHLLQEVHARDMKLIMDLVVNHTSDEHVWFQESKSSITSPYRNYYIWREGKDGGEPNNWTSSFLGSAWEYDEKSNQYYLHMFSKKQPDLNWDHAPLRQEIYEMMKFWLDKGIDGFRMDVISLISKDETALYQDSTTKGHSVCANGPRVHDYLKEMNDKVLSHYDVMSVGETPAATIDTAVLYAGADRKELNMIFQFELMDVDGGESGKWNDRRYSLQDVKEVLSKWQKGLHGKAWNSLFWNNHDQPRVVSRFGDTSSPAYCKASAKMLATALYLLQGTPYIYQGEELGMRNIKMDSIEEYRDIESIRAYQVHVEEEKSISHEDMMRYLYKASRDNARTPMQWSDDQNAGFSTQTPWIKVNPDYKQINARQQLMDDTSIFRYYQKLIRFRKSNSIIVEGSYEDVLMEHPAIYAYRRIHTSGELLVLCNFSKVIQKYDAVLCEDFHKVLGNEEESVKGILKPYESIVYAKMKHAL